MDINWQFISIYGYYVTSLTAYYSCADISIHLSLLNSALAAANCSGVVEGEDSNLNTERGSLDVLWDAVCSLNTNLLP